MKFKQIISAFAATAIAVSGLAFSATSAHAAEEPTEPKAELTNTITVTASNEQQLLTNELDQEGNQLVKTFKAVQLGELSMDEFGYAGVATVGSDATATDDEKALYNIIEKYLTDEETELNGVDPLAWISGIGPSGSSLDPDHEDDVKPWTGSDRAFVEALVAAGVTADYGTAVTPTHSRINADETNKKFNLTLTFDKPGLYLIFDVAADDTGMNTAPSFPILVATEILNAKNHYITAEGEDGEQWPASYAGKIEIKNEIIQVTKTVDEETAKVGDTLHYTLTGALPSTNAATEDNPYVYRFDDFPGTGQTVDLNSIEVFVDANTDGEYSAEGGDAKLTDADYKVTDVDGNEFEGTELVGNNGDSFSVDLTDYVNSVAYKNADYSGQFVVTYTATVNNEAQDTVSNSVSLVSVDESTSSSADTEVTIAGTYDFQFVVSDKNAFESEDITTRLAGAEFTMTAENETDTEDGDKTKAAADAVEPLVADENGVVTLTGLTLDTTYTVEQTKTVAGYSDQLLAKFTVKLTQNGDAVEAEVVDLRLWGSITEDLFDHDDNADTAEIRAVVNYKNIADLPITGAMSEPIMLAAAMLFGLAALVVLLKTRNLRRAARG